MRRDEEGALWLYWYAWILWVWANHPECLYDRVAGLKPGGDGYDTPRSAPPAAAGQEKLFR
jgi:hypothetical protein